MDSIKLIEALTNANGISGFEKEVIQVAKSFIDLEKLTFEKGGLGNAYIRQRVNVGKPLLLLDGHTDELGFMVQSITLKGLMKIVPIGSWDSRNIPTQKVRVFTEKKGWVTGIFASKPPHFMTEEEKNQKVSMEKLLIDIGAVSREEVVEVFGLEVGAPVVPDVAFERLTPDKLMAKAFDNRIGCALVMDLMNYFKDTELEVELAGSLTSQEEVGTRGARVAASELKPTIAIVFEGTPADDNFTDPAEVQGGIGLGAQIRHRDNSMITNPEMVRFARRIAKENGIPFQDAVRTGGGTNGGVYHMSEQGIPSIVIGVPVRYAHTHYGIISYKDYVSAFDWAVAIIQALNDEVLADF